MQFLFEIFYIYVLTRWLEIWGKTKENAEKSRGGRVLTRWGLGNGRKGSPARPGWGRRDGRRRVPGEGLPSWGLPPGDEHRGGAGARRPRASRRRGKWREPRVVDNCVDIHFSIPKSSSRHS